MEFTNIFQPAVVITLAGAIIGLIVKAVRLTTRVEDLEEFKVQLSIELEKCRGDFRQHIEKGEVHFDKRLAQEIADRQKDRMDRMQNDINDIKTMVKELTTR